MSYSFDISNTDPASPAELFASAGFTDAACREDIDLTEPWQEGVFHFYCPGTSCRVIEVTYNEDSFDVRIMAYSSPDDYELGLRFVEALAIDGESTIRSEDGDTLSPEDFRECFASKWIEEMVDMSFGMFNMLVQQGGTSTVNGAMRSFVVGPDIFRDLGFVDDRARFPARFFAAFRRLQWIDLEDYFQASVMLITLKDSSQQRRISSAGAPGLKYMLEKVDFVAVQAQDGDLLFVPWARIAEAFGDRLTRLSESLITIDPID